MVEFDSREKNLKETFPIFPLFLAILNIPPIEA